MHAGPERAVVPRVPGVDFVIFLSTREAPRGPASAGRSGSNGVIVALVKAIPKIGEAPKVKRRVDDAWTKDALEVAAPALKAVR